MAFASGIPFYILILNVMCDIKLPAVHVNLSL